MSYVILIVGVLTLVAGVILVLKPEAILGILRSNLESPALHVLAVVVRLVLGVALIVYADESRYPIILEVLGWISLAAAVVLGAIGRSNFKRLMEWALGLGSVYSRVGGPVAVLFGGFLIYAVL